MTKKKKFLRICLIVLFLFGLSLLAQNALAGGMSEVKVTLQDGSGKNVSTANTAINTTTVVFNPDGNVNTNDGIQINFQSDFNIASVVNGDVAVTQVGGNPTKGTAAVSGQDLQIPITTEGADPTGKITVTIINSHITTPTTNNTFKITIKTYDLGDDNAFGGSDGDADTLEDEGAAAVVIGTNQVSITGNVDPSLSFTLSANTCALGTLGATAIQTCQYNSTVSTNASSGYTGYIKDDGNLRNATNDVDDVAGGTTEYGVEEYGVSTSEGDSVDITATNSSATCTTNDNSTTATNAQDLTASDQSYASEAVPIASDVVTLCHSASVAGTTPAGVYASVVTITVVGNF
ncbi:MAG: hypothetical protein A2Y82_04985 [Candidatus Buchananbacteria bacterium RBG_13_36_9]|uniref:Uncharacterized protein n=1 Tax=Candidatus Buchananbacteria bacterium RBG_13_36_9 TaxID=1797530 RepID=A0A1G1XQJ3_9BACT|nr:MAG: hypothetical protein A2Y82_04985 [Candidatus Buchananbacteria bacterium RBG_13_36_9]